MLPLLQRHYRAPQHSGSAIPRKETTKTSLPQLVNALHLTYSSNNASSRHVDLAVFYRIRAAITNRRLFLWRERPFTAAAAGVGVYGGADAGCTQGVRGVYRCVYGVITAFTGSKRPESTFYAFTAPCFTPFCTVFFIVLRRYRYRMFYIFISAPAAIQGTLSWLR